MWILELTQAMKVHLYRMECRKEQWKWSGGISRWHNHKLLKLECNFEIDFHLSTKTIAMSTIHDQPHIIIVRTYNIYISLLIKVAIEFIWNSYWITHSVSVVPPTFVRSISILFFFCSKIMSGETIRTTILNRNIEGNNAYFISHLLQVASALYSFYQ